MPWGCKSRSSGAGTSGDMHAAFESLVRNRLDALIVGSSSLFRQPTHPHCEPSDAPWNSHDL